MNPYYRIIHGDTEPVEEVIQKIAERIDKQILQGSATKEPAGIFGPDIIELDKSEYEVTDDEERSRKMELTDALKEQIDKRSHYDILHKIRFGKLGDVMMQGESGEYMLTRREELRATDPGGAVRDSKEMGWGRGW